jgi:outer membrane protein assembly factor BamB
VYAHFGSQGLYCYKIDGEPVWSRDFGDMRTRNEFGEGSSPTITGDKIIVPWDHEGQSYLYALNKLNGDIIWQVERDEPTNWSTPLVVEHDRRKQVVMNGQNYARAYDLETGDELWRCDGQTQRPAASAVAMSDTVFVASGFRGSFVGAFRLGGRGDIEGSSEVLWTKGRDTPDIASPLLSDGRLYYYKAKTGILTCIDAATGEPHYTSKRTRLRTTYASPVAAGGHVYLSDRDGKTIVISDANEYQEVATNSIGEAIDATPAPVDDQLFIRGEQHLFCIQE